MCGIAGVISIDDVSNNYDGPLKEAMTLLARRGPDSQDFFKAEKFLLAHSRLSIQDPSDRGDQPMTSVCGRYHLVFNGEVYNFKELKQGLISNYEESFNSDTDTEVLLHLLVKFDIEEVLEKIKGMYAFCFIDSYRSKAILARDQFGQKPLYYSMDNKNFIFASTLESLTCFTKNKEINKNALTQFLDVGFILQPSTICNDVFQLGRGCYVSLDFSSDALIGSPMQRLLNKNSELYRPNGLKKVLRDSVGGCLVSDVPVGSFLSGGIDSTLVTYFASTKISLDTFCVGFKNKAYDESENARRVSEVLGTNHHTYYLEEDEIETIVNEGSKIFSEPFSDPSYIPLVALSKYARNYVKVALTGDGGDELFYGYNRHIFIKKIEFFKHSWFLKNVIRGVGSCPSLATKIGALLGYKVLGEKLAKLKSLMSSKDELYWSFFKAGEQVGFHLEEGYSITSNEDLSKTIRRMDLEYYQLSNTLVKSDRSSMWSGLELRAPFLESDVYSFANSNVNPSNQIQFNSGKQSLRKLAYSLVGRELLDRPKAGFTPPLISWMQGPLLNWINAGLAMLNASSCRSDSYPIRLDCSSIDYLYYLFVWRLSVLGHWIHDNEI